MRKEIWKPVSKFDGYEVSSFGRVRSFKRGKVKIMSHRNKSRYPLVLLINNNGKRCAKRVHNLVMETFVGLCPKNLEVCHNDGNPLNNRLENLRYDTHANNMKDRTDMGVLTPDQAKEIRWLYAGGHISQSQIAKRYSVSHGVISALLRGKTYKKAGGPIFRNFQMIRNRAKRIREEYATKKVLMKELSVKYNLDLSTISRIIGGQLNSRAGGPIKGIDY